MNNLSYPCVATIAGSDPSGGAGIQADIKAISATGSYAASIITTLTAQNTHGVQSTLDIPPYFIKQQIESVFSDLSISVVKIGVLHNDATIDVVASCLQRFSPKHIVLDPVMLSKNGYELLNPSILDHLKAKIFSLSTLITPNLFEAQRIISKEINTFKEMELAARNMGQQFKKNILLKGGHLNSDRSSDIVYLYERDQLHWFYAQRIQTKNTHGTGCSLSSAIASYLAQSYSLLDAIAAGKEYLTKALQAGNSLQIGQGNGPISHFYFLEKTKK